MVRSIRLFGSLLAGGLALLAGPGPAHAQLPPLRSIATFSGPVRPAALPPEAVSDGGDLVVWQVADTLIRVRDLATGTQRDVTLPRSGCSLRTAHAGVAALDCSSPHEYGTPLDPVVLVTDLSNGRSAAFEPALGNVAGEDPEVRPVVAVGRHWLEGEVESGDLHTSARRYYVSLTTGRLVWGRVIDEWGEGPDDRIRDLDTPDLRMLTCGPSWGAAAASSAPYFVHVGYDISSTFIDRCRHGKLVRQTRLRVPPDLGANQNVAMSSTLTLLYGAQRAAVYRNSDGALLGSLAMPGPAPARDSALAAGSRLVVWSDTEPQRLYATGGVSLAAPPRRTPRLIVHPGRGIGEVRLGMAPDPGGGTMNGFDVADLLGPGRVHGDVRVYLSGPAPVAARYSPMTGATRVTTTWSRATVGGHRLGLGLRRLARLLPSWRHPACHGRLLAHGRNPATVLTTTPTGQVRATVQATPAPRCTRRG